MTRSVPSGIWHGHKLTSLQVNGFRLAEISYSPDYKIARHAHESPIFYLVREGSFTQTYGRKTREGKASSLLYLRADETHADKFHRAGAQTFVIELPTNWGARNINHHQLNDSASYDGGIPAWLAKRIYHEYEDPDELSPLAIEALVLELIVETSRARLESSDIAPQRWLTQAEELIRARFAERLSLNDVAKAVDVHPVHLARAFRQHFRCSVGEYVRRLRVQSAREAILTTEAPLTEIAMAMGFYDQGHFTKTFKRLTGLTPSALRAATRTRSR